MPMLLAPLGLALPAVAAAAAAVLAPSAAAAAPPPTAWTHKWDTAGESWWGDFGYSLLTEPQAEFIAQNYFLASLEKCTGHSAGLPTEEGIYQTARQLKKHNPKVKTTFYWHTGQAGIGCYAANATFSQVAILLADHPLAHHHLDLAHHHHCYRAASCVCRGASTCVC
jgi:hypothetical protein